MDIKTDCKNCVFSKGKDGCSLGRHQKFADNGATIEYDENGDGIIVGRFCSLKRPESWGVDKADLEVCARNEVLAKTHVFIYTRDWGFAPINRTTRSLSKQLLPPSGITIIGPANKLTSVKFEKIVSKGNIVASIDPLYDRFQSLDSAIKDCKAPFYVLVDTGYVFPEQLLANIDEKLNGKLERFSYIDGSSSFIYGSSLDNHVKLGGNKAGTLFDGENEITFASSSLKTKVMYLAKKDNQQYLIKEYSEFLSNE